MRLQDDENNWIWQGRSGIENNSGRDFKDLRGMHQNTKLLKRNDGHATEFLLLPRSSLVRLER